MHHGALAHLLSINAVRASEAAGVRIEDYRETVRGHRVLHLLGRDIKPATMPLTAPVLRNLEARRRLTHRRAPDPAAADRQPDGPPRLLPGMVVRAAKAAGIPRHISPHSLRHAAITTALDAGVLLRDAQILARRADPRTTEQPAR